MFVKILTTCIIASYAMFGVNVDYCNSCGMLWDRPDFTYATYGDECEYFGWICPECVDYWLGEE